MGEPWTIERAAREDPPIFHPLAGANFRTFWNLHGANRPYDGRSIAPRAVSSACSVIRQPFYAFKKARHGPAIRSHVPSAPPIFIIGHWRSGTTHLHNLMSRDPRFGWITLHQTSNPWSMTGPGVDLTRRLMDIVLPETRGMDNVSLSLDSPQEEEMALGNMNPLGFYNCYYFPRNFRDHFARSILFENLPERSNALEQFREAYRELHRRLSHNNEGRRILFKNPPSTARLSFLKETFPGAKFIHIVRNPFDVFKSTRAHFARVLNAFAWQKFDDLDFEEITLRNYELLMQHYLQEREQLAEDDLIETSYEGVVTDPMGELKRLYQHLDIPLEEGGESVTAIQTYLDTLKDYQKSPHTLSAEEVDKIQDRWGFALEEWGYEGPEVG